LYIGLLSLAGIFYLSFKERAQHTPRFIRYAFLAQT